jgi:hypothetical protein
LYERHLEPSQQDYTYGGHNHEPPLRPQPPASLYNNLTPTPSQRNATQQ